MTDEPASADERRRLVVLGCGFGGFSLITRLSPKRFDVTLVSPRNHFLFNPLLASATVGTVEFRSIVEPPRRRARHVRLLEAAAEGVDWRARTVACRSAVGEDRFTIGFDLLVIAVGAAVADYGVAGVFEHALTLRSLEDARAIRRRLLEQFASAEVPDLTSEERARRLTFVVCGGGATGVEVAAEIGDLIDGEVRRYLPELAPLARVVLIEATDHILTGFDDALARYALEHFRREGIEVRMGAVVEAIEPDRVRLRGGGDIPCGMVVWAAGNAPVPLLAKLDQPTGPNGRLRVDSRLRLPGRDGAYALGDCATFDETPLPATAQVAQSQGKYLARALARGLRGKPVGPFRFRTSGMLAYIGAGEALADTPHVKWSGRSAWFFWRSVYLTKLVGFPNKVKVLFDWIKARLFGRDLSRF
jgi:NADH:quinone reductase (non-electrogenic)